MDKDNVKRILELLSKTTFELKQIKRGYNDIEALKKWMRDTDIHITFSAEGWLGGELYPTVLYSSDFDDITKAAIDVIYKRLGARNSEALEYAREIQEILTEVKNDEERSE